MNNNYNYRKSYRVIYRGCSFHSLLEVKFAISIEDQFHFLRELVVIHYEPDTFQPTNYIRETTRKYKPDFLIRHKQNNEAFLIELKPRGINCCNQIERRRQVAENYINRHKKDWVFKVIYDDEIILSEAGEQKFNVFKRWKQSFATMFDFEKLDRKYNTRSVNYFSGVPFFPENRVSRDEYVRLVKSGQS